MNTSKAILLAVCGTLAAMTAQAGLPEPDNLVFGTIAINGKAVTAADTDVRVEARRAISGPAIATYRMGDSRLAGDLFYQLRLPLESIPATNTANFSLGETLFIFVFKGTNIINQGGFQIAEWGDVARIDFGASVDTDSDGIPDGWEKLYFGGDAPETDGNGFSSFDEYLQGATPNNPSTLFHLNVQQIGPGQPMVSFLARRATGIGYEGRSRFYSLEYSTNLFGGSWSSIGSFDRILARDQTVQFSSPFPTNAPVFFRGRVWLEGP
jgi:hypothetical protein